MAKARGISKDGARALTKNQLRCALNRADRIVGWMADYIGRMAPPSNGLVDLNDHWLFMERHGHPSEAPASRGGRPLDQGLPQ